MDSCGVVGLSNLARCLHGSRLLNLESDNPSPSVFTETAGRCGPRVQVSRRPELRTDIGLRNIAAFALTLSAALIIATPLLQGQTPKLYVSALQAIPGADLGLALVNPTLTEAKVTLTGFTRPVDELAPSAMGFEGYAVVEAGVGPQSKILDSLIGFETYRNRSDIALIRAFPESARLRTGFLAHLASQGGYS